MNPTEEEVLKLLQSTDSDTSKLNKKTFLNQALSVDSLNNKSIGILLQRDLNKLLVPPPRLEKMKEIVAEGNFTIPERQLAKIDPHSTTTCNLPCSRSVTCFKSEAATNESLVDFLALFNHKTKPVTKQSSLPKIPASTEVKIKSVTSFKTAGEALNMQSNKIGSGTTDNGGAMQKRRLGNRRCVKGKFVSPLLSNNNSNEESASKSQEWDQQTSDDRLKNIEPRMVELIKSEIMDCGAPVTWDDIAGLEFAKIAIQEAVVWPMLRPDIFTGLRRPPKGILLFGPPGTGKTLIGKCVASQSKSTFFSISASSLTSKWIGDGEKMVRALFAVARCHQPAVIFIDEIDSLLSQRSETEHESSRRIKTEFLIQLDGATTDNEERLLVVGATNRPQELDEAARRRFVKRLYIPLPEKEARLQLVTKLISNERHELRSENFVEISELSDGYSGADMRNLCADASMGPIRSIDMSLIQSIQTTEVRPINMDDFRKALNRVRSSVSPNDLNQYVIWDNTYGSGSFS